MLRRALFPRLLATTAALAAPVSAAGWPAPQHVQHYRAVSADDRAGMVRAYRQIRRRFGGRRISQRWNNGRVLVVWQPERGDSLLIRIIPRTGDWVVIGNAPARR